ncbi:MAG: hypothetical protein ABGX98_00090, partial [Pseudomonadota bacterium]
RKQRLRTVVSDVSETPLPVYKLFPVRLNASHRSQLPAVLPSPDHRHRAGLRWNASRKHKVDFATRLANRSLDYRVHGSHFHHHLHP